MTVTVETVRSARPAPAPRARRAVRRRTSLFAHGEPMVWLTGGALVISLVMIAGLLLLVLWQGIFTFWPQPVVRMQLADGRDVMGEVTESERYVPEETALAFLEPDVRARADAALAEGDVERRQLRVGNYELTGRHFEWIDEFAIVAEDTPEWALVVERLTWGRFYGEPAAFRLDGEVVTTDPAEVWRLYGEHHDASRERWRERRVLETKETGEVAWRLENARLEARQAELDHGADSPEVAAANDRFDEVEAEATVEFGRIRSEIEALNTENDRFQMVLATADGQEKSFQLGEVVRAYPANNLNLAERVGVYLSRWWEFLWDEPRQANQEGGVFPAIFGTVVMTLIMSIVVVPFGVLAALYLREYAKQGFVVSAIRIAVNNLAGVPSIVFGVFGLGFFCYIVGGGIDQVFFEARLPNPTYGKSGLMWASLTLALLTLPVVIVATEEALSAVPSSMREGSYACGATKWQTIRRIVLPRAAPGIMTGMILAIARGAGEVAPLMLVGAVKYVPDLVVDDVAPFFHPDRSFMHLGFHIFDLGFHSPNSEAAKPMVYTTTLLLIGVVVSLNILAIWIRARLRRKFQGTHI